MQGSGRKTSGVERGSMDRACLSLYWPGKSFVALEEQETRMGVWNKRLADPGTMGARQAPGIDAGTLVFKTISAQYKTHYPS